MKRSRPEQIGQLIDRLMEQYKLDRDLNSHRACNLWKETVGPGVAQYTTRSYVKQNTLHVFISSAPLKHELLFQRQHILDAINKQLKTPLQSLIIH